MEKVLEFEGPVAYPRKATKTVGTFELYMSPKKYSRMFFRNLYSLRFQKNENNNRIKIKCDVIYMYIYNSTYSYIKKTLSQKFHS